MRIEPYLNLCGRCDEAIAFYRQALGAELAMLIRFDEAPDPPPPGVLVPGWEHKVMHSMLQIGGAHLMATDGTGRETPGFAGVTLSIATTDLAAAARMFDALADGGEVQMPLGKTFWSPAFGMVKDRFGVAWMLNGEA